MYCGSIHEHASVRGAFGNISFFSRRTFKSVDICESRVKRAIERQEIERVSAGGPSPRAPLYASPRYMWRGRGGWLGRLTVLGPFVVRGRVGVSRVGEDTTRGDDNRSALLFLGHDHPFLRAFDVLDCLRTNQNMMVTL